MRGLFIFTAAALVLQNPISKTFANTSTHKSSLNVFPLNHGICQPFSPVLAAAENGNLLELRKLIQAGADLFDKADCGNDKNIDALTLAAGSNSMETLKWIVSHTPQVNNFNWSDAVFMAAAKNKLEAVKLLMARGAELDVLNHKTDLESIAEENEAAEFALSKIREAHSKEVIDAGKQDDMAAAQNPRTPYKVEWGAKPAVIYLMDHSPSVITMVGTKESATAKLQDISEVCDKLCPGMEDQKEDCHRRALYSSDKGKPEVGELMFAFAGTPKISKMEMMEFKKEGSLKAKAWTSNDFFSDLIDSDVGYRWKKTDEGLLLETKNFKTDEVQPAYREDQKGACILFRSSPFEMLSCSSTELLYADHHLIFVSDSATPEISFLMDKEKFYYLKGGLNYRNRPMLLTKTKDQWEILQGETSDSGKEEECD